MRITIIAVLVFVGGFFCSCGQRKAAQTEVLPDTLSIMSFNIRYDNPEDGENSWQNRKEACVRMIRTIKPDVFGIQEGLDNQVEDLETLLHEYHRQGEGRSPGEDSNEYAAIFYLKDKFEFLAGNTFWLSETPDSISRGWDARYNRVATWVHLKDKSRGKTFLYFNTHLDHKGEVARIESTRLIVDKLKEVNKDSVAVFLSGDFNALPNDPLFAPVKAYMKDVRMEVNPADSTQTTNGWGKEPQYKVIDYIFFKYAEPIGYKVITEDYGVPYISDHYPILGTFKY